MIESLPVAHQSRAARSASMVGSSCVTRVRRYRPAARSKLQQLTSNGIPCGLGESGSLLKRIDDSGRCRCGIGAIGGGDNSKRSAQ
jgi:hypothetical protein